MSLAQTSKAMEDRMHRGISFCNVFRVTAIGANSAVQPTIISVLKILLPTTLPMAISALPFRAEDTLTVNSGADVPKATIVSPITILGMRKRLATDAAPSVSPFALVNAENCSETGVEIIAPYYMVTRDGNVSTAPKDGATGKEIIERSRIGMMVWFFPIQLRIIRIFLLT